MRHWKGSGRGKQGRSRMFLRQGGSRCMPGGAGETEAKVSTEESAADAPREAEAKTAAKPSKNRTFAIDPDVCKGCGKCAGVCPTGAIHPA